MANRPALAFLAFITPCTVFMEFNLVGRIFAPELILIGLLPFLLLMRGRMLADPLPRFFLFMAFSWLCAQILTDLIRDTPFADYSRGWSKIIFTTMNFCTLYMLLYGSRQRIVLFDAPQQRAPTRQQIALRRCERWCWRGNWRGN